MINSLPLNQTNISVGFGIFLIVILLPLIFYLLPKAVKGKEIKFH